MNKLFSAIFLFLLIYGCKSPQKEPTSILQIVENPIVNTSVSKVPSIDSAKLGVNFKPIGNYSSIKRTLLSDRLAFKNSFDAHPEKAIDSASKYLYHKLINEIVPHWYNTTWDFNGHTNIPRDGDIACGYFVSTTLKHLGFNLNRYRMAQQAGLNEAKTLQNTSRLKTFSNLSFNKLKEKLNEVYNDGIYFVGLDNHVGYVLIEQKEIYFLHSSYYDDKVMLELAETSPCFESNFYVFAEITTNKVLIEKWILNEKLKVPNS